MTRAGWRAPRGCFPGNSPPWSTRWVVLTVLCVSMLIVNLDNTVLNVALPTLVRELRATSSQLQWIVDAYALAFAGLLLAGSVADRVGRKRTFPAGLVEFAAAGSRRLRGTLAPECPSDQADRNEWRLE